jgi:hypothetical protein
VSKVFNVYLVMEELAVYGFTTRSVVVGGITANNHHVLHRREELRTNIQNQ